MFVGWLLRNQIFTLSVRVSGPWDVIYFLKSMTKSCHIVVVGVVLASLMPRLGGEFSLILAFVGDDMDYHIMMQHIFLQSLSNIWPGEEFTILCLNLFNPKLNRRRGG